MSRRRRVPRYQRQAAEEAREKAEQRRAEIAAQWGLEVRQVPHDLPEGAIPADLSQQVPWNSYSAAPLYYVDRPFTCRDCGREEIWTAAQQKWWYEVAKGSLYSTAVRCRDCRRARRNARQQ